MSLTDDELIAEIIREAQEEEAAERAWMAAHPGQFTLNLPGKLLMVTPFSEPGAWRIGSRTYDNDHNHTV